MIILTLDQISRYLEYFGINLSYTLLTPYEQSILFILANILWWVIVGFMFYVVYKIFSRLINAIF